MSLNKILQLQNIYAVRYFSRSLNLGCADIKSLKRTEPFNGELVWPADDDDETFDESRILLDVEFVDVELFWWNGCL